MNIVMSSLSKGREVEVLEKPQRRRFTLEYKRRILREADRCQKPGEVGALLRREGLYSSHLSSWRAARDRGELGGRGTRRRGPEAKRMRFSRSTGLPSDQAKANNSGNSDGTSTSVPTTRICH